MRVGPVEVIVCAFPEHTVRDAVVEALGEAVQAGAVALIDLVLIKRGKDGALTILDLDDDLPPVWADMIIDPRPLTLLSDGDIALASRAIRNDELAVVAAVEHRWARRLSEEIRHAGGLTSLHVRVPHDEVVRAFEADGVAAK